MWSYLSLQVFTLRSWIHGTNNSSYNLHCINIKERLIILKSPEWWLFCRAFQQLSIKKLFFNLYRHQENNLLRKDLQLFASVIKKTSWYNITLLKLTYFWGKVYSQKQIATTRWNKIQIGLIQCLIAILILETKNISDLIVFPQKLHVDEESTHSSHWFSLAEVSASSSLQ